MTNSKSVLYHLKNTEKQKQPTKGKIEKCENMVKTKRRYLLEHKEKGNPLKLDLTPLNNPGIIPLF